MNEPLLIATDVHKIYRMGQVELHVLRGCGLAVQPGEFVAIMGRSGTGKSTLLHILGALDVPQRGQVTFGGEPVFAPPGQRWFRTSPLDVLSAGEVRRIGYRRRKFGFVFQAYHLLPELTVLENVLLARMIGTSTFQWPKVRNEARRDAIDVLQRVGLGDRLEHRPAELSGGERQRVAIARALVHRPAVLLADEPTGNLDAEAGAELMNLLGGLHKDGQTVVMVTHDTAVAARADRILMLEGGKLRQV